MAAPELPSSPYRVGAVGGFRARSGACSNPLAVSGDGQAARKGARAVRVCTGCDGQHLLSLPCPCYCHRLLCATLGLSCVDCVHRGCRLHLCISRSLTDCCRDLFPLSVRSWGASSVSPHTARKSPVGRLRDCWACAVRCQKPCWLRWRCERRVTRGRACSESKPVATGSMFAEDSTGH